MSQEFNKKGVVTEGYIGRRAILEQRVIEGLETPVFDSNNILRLKAESAETQFLPDTYTFTSLNEPIIYLPDENTLWNNWRITVINSTTQDINIRLYNASENKFILSANSMATYILLDNITKIWTLYRTDTAIVANDHNTVVKKLNTNFSYTVLTNLINGNSAEGTITFNANASDNDTITITDGNNDVVYTFKTTVSNAYDVQIGSNASISASNLVSAINADGSSVYGTGTEANPYVSAINSQEIVNITAINGGIAGNSIVLESSNSSIETSEMSGGTDYTNTDSAIYALGTVKAGNSVKSIMIQPVQAWSVSDDSDFTLTLKIGRYTTEIIDEQEVSVFQPLFYTDGLDIKINPANNVFNKELFDTIISTTEDTDLFVQFQSDNSLADLVSGEVRISVEIEGEMQSVQYKNSTISSNVPLGTIFPYAFDDTPVGFVRLDGSTKYLQNNDPFVKKLYEYATKTGQNLIITENEYNTELNTYGSCGKFCWTTNNGILTNNLKFPTIRHYIKGFGIQRNINTPSDYTPLNGNTENDSLRNFTGTFNIFGTGVTSGAFTSTLTNSETKLAVSGTIAEHEIKLNVPTATNSSDGTEPKHTYYPYIMCYSMQSVNTEISDDTYNQILRKWQQSDPLTPKKPTSALDSSLFILVPDFNTYSQTQEEAIVKIDSNTQNSPFTASEEVLAIVHYKICNMPSNNNFGGYAGNSYIYESVIKFSDTSNTYYRTGIKINNTITWSDWQSIYIPTGQIMIYPGSNIPSGWLNCNGQVLPISGPYTNLFNIIGYTYTYVRCWKNNSDEYVYTYDPVILDNNDVYNDADAYFMPYANCPAYNNKLETNNVIGSITSVILTFSSGSPAVNVECLRVPDEDTYKYYAWKPIGSSGNSWYYTLKTDTDINKDIYYKSIDFSRTGNVVSNIKIIVDNIEYNLDSTNTAINTLEAYQVPNILNKTLWGNNSISKLGNVLQAGYPNHYHLTGWISGDNSGNFCSIGGNTLSNGLPDLGSQGYTNWNGSGGWKGQNIGHFPVYTGNTITTIGINCTTVDNYEFNNGLIGTSNTVQPNAVCIQFVIKY